MLFESAVSQQDDLKDEEQSFNCKTLFKYLGPGLLISIAYIDPGNLSGDINAGQTAQYALLWVLFWSTTLGFFFQTYALKLGIVTGKDMAKLCRMYYGYKYRILLWIMAEIAIMGSDIQEVLGTAIALKIITGIDLWIGVIISITSTMLILLVKYYGMRILEVFFAVLIGVMGVCFSINLGLAGADFGKMMFGTFVPTIPSGSAQALVGLVGSVLMPHNLYLHSSLMNEKEKKIDNENKKLVKTTILYNTIETGASLFISFLINAAVLSCFVQFGDQEDIDLENAGDVLKNNFGVAAKYIWAIGLLAAGQSSTLTGTLAGQYIMEGFIKFKISKFKRALITRMVAIVPAFVIAFTSDVSSFNGYLNVLQAIQLPFAVIPLLKFSSNVDIMKSNRISPVILIFLIVCSVAMVIMNFYAQIPSEINWHGAWIYIEIIIAIFYFIFMGSLIFQKLKVQKDHKSLLVIEDTPVQTQDQYIDSSNIDISNQQTKKSY